MMEGLIGGLFPYMAVGIFLVGAGVRIILWQTAPRKLNWKLYPVPEGLAGEASYILGEWVSFRTLFRHNRIVWLGSYVFHLSLVWLVVWLVLFLLGIHLPWLLRTALWGMFGSAVYLFIVRLWVKQMRAISSLVEYLNLLLFILIASSGLSMLGRGVGGQVREYFLGLLTLSPAPVPSEGMFLVHLLLWELFLVYLPFSKMFHAASKYFAYHKSRWYNPYEVGH
jgi:nitrate reductase gamma subunit